MIQHPLTIASIGRPDMTLTAHLTLGLYDQDDYNQGLSPLEHMFKKYSGLKLNFANSSKKTGADGNIELNKLDTVWLKTQTCVQKILEAGKVIENPLLKNINYVPNRYGNLAKQPALSIARAVTFEQASDLASELINATGQFAKRNKENGLCLQDAAYIAYAEKNAILPQIDTAEHRTAFLNNMAADPNYGFYARLCQMLDEHPEYLNMNTAEPAIVVYESDMKTPNTSKVDAEGRTKVYSMSVTCTPGQALPFNVSLTVGTGIPVQGRAIGIQPGTYRTNQDGKFNLSLTCEEWVYLISSAVKMKDAYMAANIGNQMGIAIQEDRKNRASWQQR